MYVCTAIYASAQVRRAAQLDGDAHGAGDHIKDYDNEANVSQQRDVAENRTDNLTCPYHIHMRGLVEDAPCM